MFDATTILAYKGKNKAVIGGDGQVTFGDSVLKGNATKIRTLHKGKILAGFAGSTADAFNLFDMFEDFLEDKKGDLLKSVVEFSKAWRKDKVLRRLEAMMIVLNNDHIFIHLIGTVQNDKYKLGYFLLSLLEDIARTNKYKILKCSSVYSAEKFYVKNKWKVINHNIEDEVIEMEKILPNPKWNIFLQDRYKWRNPSSDD